MQEHIQQVLQEQHILSHSNEGITVCIVKDAAAGIALANEILSRIVDKKTAIYLAGGSLQFLYEILAKEETITPGAVGLIDERFGPKFHANSNEKMIRETGLLRYLEILGIPFYPILQAKSRIETAEAYDAKFRELNTLFQKSVGLVGIGPDGHISSIIPNRPDFHNPWFDLERKNLMVSEFDDPKSHYKERVGMTFLALAMLDLMIVPVFGENKKEMLEKLFSNGSEVEIPARFFKRAEIAPKTFLITDQEI